MLSRQGLISSAMSTSNNHPQKIGPWKLGRTLGRGATGRVLLGVNSSTGQKAAVKVVSKSELNDEYDKPSKGGLPYGIEREIIIMKLLTHPNVLRLYDVWETSKALYLVLEYVEGGELFDLLVERGPLQEEEAIKYFRQIILGTAYCHALGICHRDLKPENLLLDSALNVKLADFGMAALESEGKLLETSCGSPHYAAPEIVSGLKYHGAASDVWSCGVILFALLTGRLPFDDENIRNLLLKVQAGNFDMPEEISEDAQDLIWRMLTVDPMARLTTPEVLNHPLLAKYPIPNEDLISVKSLPHPETAYRSLGSVKNIDKQILENLSILWHDRSEDEIVQCLLDEGSNPEKTFYALLLRYRHNQADGSGSLASSSSNSPAKRIPHSTSSMSNRVTPRRRASKINASTARNRPVSFQRRPGQRGSVINTGRMSASSSVQNSPFKSPARNSRAISQSPSKSPRRLHNQHSQQFNSANAALPRNLYNDIMSAQQEQEPSMGSLPPTLPSKDSIYNNGAGIPGPNGAVADGGVFNDKEEAYYNTKSILESAPEFSNSGAQPPPRPPHGAGNKRSSIINQKAANRMSKRKSIRQSLSSGLKRNSITVRLLSTYARLAGETDWEYMDKQTRRTSATFATLCDKIFNQEDYNEEDEKLEDEEEKKAKEYEKLMEAERKKHEAELKARRELAKQKKRLKRKSLLSSSKKMSITVTDDGNGKTDEVDPLRDDKLLQPKRQSKNQNALRSISEGGNGEGNAEELTSKDVENIKRRSVTQPTPRRRLTPILTRRPVSRLDPLWIAHENKEMTRAQEALNDEIRDFEKQKRRANRESMVSVGNDDDVKRLSKNSDYDATNDFHLPEHEAESGDLSEEYMSEIRKSRLLNSQYNINAQIKDAETAPKKRGSGSKLEQQKNEDRKTLIGSVNIPKVTRKSSHFSASNKRLSILTMRSTRESYRDLNSILDAHNEDVDENELADEERGMPQLRTSFADRLDRVGLSGLLLEEGDEDGHLSEDNGSVMDFDEHLANKRSSYYGGKPKRYSTTRRHPPKKDNTDREDTTARRGESQDRLGGAGDYTFSEDAEDKRRGSGADVDNDGDVFDNIKLPDEKRRPSKPDTRGSNTKSMQPSASNMLLPDMDKYEAQRKTQASNGTVKPSKEMKPKAEATAAAATANGPKKPLVDSTNTQKKKKATTNTNANGGAGTGNGDGADQQQTKGKRSIFRKLSWGTKKMLDGGTQLPSPVDSGSEERKSGGGFFSRWFSTDNKVTANDVKRYRTILPKQEMLTALYALLTSWTNFGLKDLRKDAIGFNITGAISSSNSFNLKSCKFRIKVNSRDVNQKSELICAKMKGSSATANTLFTEIQRVLQKEGVLDK